MANDAIIPPAMGASNSARPIIFSAPMVRALLDGRKTQTRRALKPQPLQDGNGWRLGDILWFDASFPVFAGQEIARIIRFAPGDRLYVKESWRTESRAYDDLPPSAMDADYPVIYDADADWSQNKSVGRRRASIHMPRWASRLTLIVESVKVERLQDISEADAMAEGAMHHRPCKSAVAGTTVASDTYYFDETIDGRLYEDASARGAFEILWGKINGWQSWDANPWVAAISFRVIKANIDAIPFPKGGEE